MASLLVFLRGHATHVNVVVERLGREQLAIAGAVPHVLRLPLQATSFIILCAACLSSLNGAVQPSELEILMMSPNRMLVSNLNCLVAFVHRDACHPLTVDDGTEFPLLIHASMASLPQSRACLANKNFIQTPSANSKQIKQLQLQTQLCQKGMRLPQASFVLKPKNKYLPHNCTKEWNTTSGVMTPCHCGMTCASGS